MMCSGTRCSGRLPRPLGATGRLSMRVAICALLTGVILIPGAVLGIAVGGLVNATLPGNATDPIKLALTVLSALIGMFVGGAAWGSSISRVTKVAAGRPLAVACGIGLGL